MSGLKKMNRWVCRHRGATALIVGALTGAGTWAIHEFWLKDKMLGSPVSSGVGGAAIGLAMGYAGTSKKACRAY